MSELQFQIRVIEFIHFTILKVRFLGKAAFQVMCKLHFQNCSEVFHFNFVYSVTVVNACFKVVILTV